MCTWSKNDGKLCFTELVKDQRKKQQRIDALEDVAAKYIVNGVQAPACTAATIVADVTGTHLAAAAAALGDGIAWRREDSDSEDGGR